MISFQCEKCNYLALIGSGGSDQFTASEKFGPLSPQYSEPCPPLPPPPPPPPNVQNFPTPMHEVLVNRLGGLSLPRKSLVRFTDRPDMTLDV